MRQWTRSIVTGKRMRLMLLLPLLLMAASCSSLTNHSPTWPQNLKVISLSDGGVCLSPDSAIRLAELKAELEAL